MNTNWTCIFALLASSAAYALPPEGVRVVDQAVGDLDPLSNSLRQIEWGLAELGEHGYAMWQVPLARPTPLADQPTLIAPWMPPHHQNVYYRIGGGYRARMTRPSYLIPISKRDALRNITPLRDGQFIEIVTHNTVYELTPTPAFLPDPDPDHRPDPNALRLTPLNDRIDGRLPTP